MTSAEKARHRLGVKPVIGPPDHPVIRRARYEQRREQQEKRPDWCPPLELWRAP